MPSFVKYNFMKNQEKFSASTIILVGPDNNFSAGNETKTHGERN
jgi:hypothetical protein